ncbi:uncharacterized protein LOC143446433 [Clavelina lepadiformis]|uniref:uncharacterized protein LOC143446433 n=1 Tax=Clavelina lepadiformis TaxID=159417 RepID=UPI004042DBAE
MHNQVHQRKKRAKKHHPHKIKWKPLMLRLIKAKRNEKFLLKTAWFSPCCAQTVIYISHFYVDATRNEKSSNATYAEVNKPKKKNKPLLTSRANNADTTQVEASSNATYAEVNKPKKKKKPPLPSRANTAGWDATNDDVVLHGWSPTPN